VSALLLLTTLLGKGACATTGITGVSGSGIAGGALCALARFTGTGTSSCGLLPLCPLGALGGDARGCGVGSGVCALAADDAAEADGTGVGSGVGALIRLFGTGMTSLSPDTVLVLVLPRCMAGTGITSVSPVVRALFETCSGGSELALRTAVVGAGDVRLIVEAGGGL